MWLRKQRLCAFLILNVIFCECQEVGEPRTWPCNEIAYKVNCSFLSLLFKAADLQNILNIISYNKFKISLQIYIIVVRNKKPTYFHFFALKTDNSLFCHRDIPTIHNGYCVSNAVDYAKKNDVLPTIFQLN